MNFYKEPPEILMEEKYEWRKWSVQIPYIQFPQDWLIQIAPPLLGAVIRFRVKKAGFKKGDEVSVYLDCYNKLGIYSLKEDAIPYWEIYPAKDGDTERFKMDDIDGLLKGISDALGSRR